MALTLKSRPTMKGLTFSEVKQGVARALDYRRLFLICLKAAMCLSSICVKAVVLSLCKSAESLDRSFRKCL